MYSAVPEGSLPLRLKPTFAKANATSAKAKTSMISSVRRLPRVTGSQRTRRVNRRRRGGNATHECPVAAGARVLAAMPNAVEGGHIPSAFGGCGPGLGGTLGAGFLAFLASLARASAAW